MRRARRYGTIILFFAACSLLPAKACDQGTTQTQAQLYRIPSSIKTIRALSAKLGDMTSALVVRIVDGDTIVVSFGADTGLGTNEKVRLIGVDTPETVDPRKPIERYGIEAARFAQERLINRTVRLAFEPTLRDYYGRLLAYVFLDDGTCFNLDVIAEGYGFAYTKYPFLFMDEFRRTEQLARSQRRGLWGP
jgi:micrococcal nuclease